MKINFWCEYMQSENEYIDEWGCAGLWCEDDYYGDTIYGVEYNYCIDNGINCSAIYLMESDKEWEVQNTDHSRFVHYEIDFTDNEWKEKLKQAMIDALFSMISFEEDEEKMRDFHYQTKEEFLKSYSYLSEAEYEATLTRENERKENMTIDQKLEQCYSDLNMEWGCGDDISKVRRLMCDDWGKGADRGYAIFGDDHYTDLLFECINRIDEYEIYDGDTSAAEQAELDGFCKIIRDLRFPDGSNASVLNGTIIDDEDNRMALVRCLAEKSYY